MPKETKNFIFWGAGLNDYDGALWHFLRGFLAENPSVKVGIATRNDPRKHQKSPEESIAVFPAFTTKRLSLRYASPKIKNHPQLSLPAMLFKDKTFIDLGQLHYQLIF